MIKYYKKKGTEKATHKIEQEFSEIAFNDKFSTFASRIVFSSLDGQERRVIGWQDFISSILSDNNLEEDIENGCNHPEIFKGQYGCSYGKCNEKSMNDTNLSFTGKLHFGEKVDRALEELKTRLYEYGRPQDYGFTLEKMNNCFYYRIRHLLEEAQNLVNAIEALRAEVIIKGGGFLGGGSKFVPMGEEKKEWKCETLWENPKSKSIWKDANDLPKFNKAVGNPEVVIKFKDGNVRFGVLKANRFFDIQQTYHFKGCNIDKYCLLSDWVKRLEGK
ncbi:MAG: hypothetical protein ACRC6O_13300 [Flavobacterium sp.]